MGDFPCSLLISPRGYGLGFINNLSLIRYRKPKKKEQTLAKYFHRRPASCQGKAKIYTAWTLLYGKKTTAFEDKIKSAALANKTAISQKALNVYIDFYLEIPISWPRYKKKQAANGEILPSGKPDIDNLCKSVLDALNGVIFRDDAQIVKLCCTKQYDANPGCALLIQESP